MTASSALGSFRAWRGWASASASAVFPTSHEDSCQMSDGQSRDAREVLNKTLFSAKVREKESMFEHVALVLY